MIEKIISGGQTGADQAALDVAIKLDIPHGGWIPKGRKTEKGTLPKTYHLKELPTPSYPARTEKNVIDSDGTLIFTHGPPTGGSALTQSMANKHGQPWLHIDLTQTNAFNAAIDVSTWIEDHSIAVVNVAGSRASEDQNIYDAVMGILESAFILGLSQRPKTDSLQTLFSTKERSKSHSFQPGTVKEALDDLMATLPLKDKASIANMTAQELDSLHFTLGNYIQNNYVLRGENEALISSCRFLLKKEIVNEDEVSSLIIEELWKNLRKTHRLKVVK